MWVDQQQGLSFPYKDFLFPWYEIDKGELNWPIFNTNKMLCQTLVPVLVPNHWLAPGFKPWFLRMIIQGSDGYLHAPLNYTGLQKAMFVIAYTAKVKWE